MAIRRDWVIAWAVALTAACQAPRVCQGPSDCAQGLACIQQVCVVPPDAGTVSTSDAGTSCAVDKGGCTPTALCDDSSGAVVCKCPAGYVGNGASGPALVCTSACALANGGCDAHATCSVVGGGEISCQCNEGYTGDGLTCTQVDGGAADAGQDGGFADAGEDGGVVGVGRQCGLDPSCDAGVPVPANTRARKSCAIACPAGLVCSPAGQCEEASYSVSDAGIVTDNATGLVWQQAAQRGCLNDFNGCTPKEAESYCASLNLGGHGGWAAPTFPQLFSLVEVQPPGSGSPSDPNPPVPINPVFSLQGELGAAGGVEVSSTRSSSASQPGDWVVEFKAGRVFGQTNRTAVRCVLQDPDAGPVDAGYFDFCDPDEADAGTNPPGPGCASDQDCTATPPSTAACVQGRCVTTLFTTSDSPAGLAVSGSNVYVLERDMMPSASPNPPGEIVSIPVSGGSPVTVAAKIPNPQAFAVDARNLYWALPTPQSSVVMRPIAGGTPVTLWSQFSSIAFQFFHVGSWLYWNTGWYGSTYGLDTCGGSVQTVVDGGPAVAVTSTDVYWFQGSDLMQQSLAGGDPVTFATGVYGSMETLTAADDSHLYWTCGAICSLPLKGGPLTTLTGSTSASALATDGISVYWIESGGIGWHLEKVPVGGGAVVTLYSDPSDTDRDRWLAVDDTSVYTVQFPPHSTTGPSYPGGAVLEVTPK